MTATTVENREALQRSIQARPGKYLTFKLGEELYAVDIMKVQEIIGMQSVIKIPKTPHYVRGMINLRDRVIPVIDLRLKFDMEHKEDTRRTCIIVVQVAIETRQVILGAVVDEVSEVIDLAQDDLQPAPSFGSALDTHMIIGIGRTKEKVIMLLDADTLLSSEEIFSLKEVARQAAAQTTAAE